MAIGISNEANQRGKERDSRTPTYSNCTPGYGSLAPSPLFVFHILIPQGLH